MKCHDRDVPCVFHGILHVKGRVHTLQETWSTQTRGVSLEYLCHVSLRVHACKSEVINERYCIRYRSNATLHTCACACSLTRVCGHTDWLHVAKDTRASGVVHACVERSTRVCRIKYTRVSALLHVRTYVRSLVHENKYTRV